MRWRVAESRHCRHRISSGTQRRTDEERDNSALLLLRTYIHVASPTPSLPPRACLSRSPLFVIALPFFTRYSLRLAAAAEGGGGGQALHGLLSCTHRPTATGRDARTHTHTFTTLSAAAALVCLTDSLARSPPSSLAPRSVGPRLNRQSREGCLLLVGRLVVGRGGGGGGGLAAAASHKPGCTAQRGGGLGSGRAYDHYTTTTRFTNKSRIGRRRTDGRTDGRTRTDDGGSCTSTSPPRRVCAECASVHHRLCPELNVVHSVFTRS